MSNKLVNAVWGLNLSTTHKLVLLSLAQLADDSGICHTTAERVRALTGMGERTVRRAFGDLEELGQIVTVREPGLATLYYLTVAAP